MPEKLKICERLLIVIKLYYYARKQQSSMGKLISYMNNSSEDTSKTVDIYHQY